MQCFGCFGADTHPRARAPTPSDERKLSSFRHRSQVSDVTHLLGPAEDPQQAKQKSRILAAMQAPQFGEHAYERIGDVGRAQNAEDVQLMRHRRSKELVTVKCVKQNAGKPRHHFELTLRGGMQLSLFETCKLRRASPDASFLPPGGFLPMSIDHVITSC